MTFPGNTHLSSPVRPHNIVVREAVEEVNAAVLLPAVVGLSVILRVPLKVSGRVILYLVALRVFGKEPFTFQL